MAEDARRGRRGGTTLLAVALVFAGLLASLSAVVWRQSRAMESLRHVERLRDDAALLEARRAELARDVQGLERRARIVAVARERLGMHVPRSEEIVILPVDGGGGGT